MTNDEDSKDMALFEHTLKRATRAAGTASKSLLRTIANRGGKRVGGTRETAQPDTAAIERLAAASVRRAYRPAWTIEALGLGKVAAVTAL